MSREQHLQSMPDQYLQAVNNQELEAILALYADDAVVEDPVGSEPLHGKEAIRAFYTRVVASGAKGERTGSVRVAGDDVAFAFVLTLPGMRIEVIDTFCLNADGLIVAMRAYWGPLNTSTGEAD